MNNNNNKLKQTYNESATAVRLLCNEGPCNRLNDVPVALYGRSLLLRRKQTDMATLVRRLFIGLFTPVNVRSTCVRCLSTRLRKVFLFFSSFHALAPSHFIHCIVPTVLVCCIVMPVYDLDHDLFQRDTKPIVT